MVDGGGGQIVKLLVSNTGFKMLPPPLWLMGKERLQSFILMEEERSVLRTAGADVKAGSRPESGGLTDGPEPLRRLWPRARSNNSRRV